MKKVLAILCSAALALSLFNGVYAETSENLSRVDDAEVIVDSVHTQYSSNVAINAVDGDATTRWQSNAKGNNGDDGWIGIKWTEAKTIGKIVIDWETAHPAEGGFKVQISDDGETWNDTAFTAVRTGTDADDHQKDTITLTANPTTKYVRVLCQTAYTNGGGNVKENPSCWEFEVYAPAAAEEPATIGDGVVTAETAVVDGVKSVFVATNVAEADVPAGASIKAVFTITLDDGTSATGEELITAAYTSIALGEAELTAADINGADANDYVTGILFNNVPETATVEVAFYVAE